MKFICESHSKQQSEMTWAVFKIFDKFHTCSCASIKTTGTVLTDNQRRAPLLPV